jgi:hypothetical protein
MRTMTTSLKRILKQTRGQVSAVQQISHGLLLVGSGLLARKHRRQPNPWRRTLSELPLRCSPVADEVHRLLEPRRCGSGLTCLLAFNIFPTLDSEIFFKAVFRSRSVLSGSRARSVLSNESHRWKTGWNRAIHKEEESPIN